MATTTRLPSDTRPRCVSASRPPGHPSTTRSSSSVISNPRSHTCRLNRLPESGGLRLARRPVVLPLPPCRVALRRDLLRRSPSAFVPRHRARHHPRAPPASLLRRRVRPGLPIHGPPFTQNPGSQVAQAAGVLRPHALSRGPGGKHSAGFPTASPQTPGVAAGSPVERGRVSRLSMAALPGSKGSLAGGVLSSPGRRVESAIRGAGGPSG